VVGVRVARGARTEVIVVVRADAPPLVEIDAPPAAETAPAHPTTVDEAEVVARLTGRVTDAETGAPLAGARVLVRGRADDVVTDADGRFVVDVKSGAGALSVMHEGYSARVVDVVVDPAGTHTDVVLASEKTALERFVVKTPHVSGSLAQATAEKRASDKITEVLSSDEMSRTGAGDAASALKNVTGVTLVGGRYVYVRGLGERYSSTLLNGATLPSPEPERRVVPLDLFPTSVLAGVTVHKAYAPDLPGEFGGGAVDLKTKGVPEERVFRVSISSGGTAGTTFANGLTGHRGLLDALGKDDGSRALPDDVKRASDGQPLLERDRFSERGYTPAELEKLGESMPNTWGISRALVPPDLGLSVEAGDSVTFGALTLGAQGGLTFGNDKQRTRFRREYFAVGEGGALESGHSYDFENMEESVQLGGLFAFGARLGADHEVTSTSILGRMSDQETRVYQGYNRDLDGNIRVSRQRLVERMLLAEQVRGSHKFPFLFGVENHWRYTYALAMRDEPDMREVRYDQERDTGEWMLSDRPEGNTRFFSALQDHGHDFVDEVRLPFSQWNGLEAHVKAGAGFSTKNRVVDTRRFKFMHKGPRASARDVLTSAPEDVFVPENIGPDGFQFEETTRQTDNYDAQQTIFAGYLGGALPLWHGVLVAGGLRLEHATQTVRTYALFAADDEPVLADIRSLDVLPALSFTWGFLETMQIRTSASVTVSRPDFRELSPATFNDVTGGRQTFGNPELLRAQIYAIDARYEWYPTRGVELSTGVFYKHFVNPIEQVVVVSAQHSVTFDNAIAADNVGAELELRHDFGWIHEVLDGAYVAGNGALIYSQVTLDESAGIQTENVRPLQGQSPFVLNLQAGWDASSTGTRAVVLYNVVGPRITEVGAAGAPDIYEQPFHRLDVVVRQALPWGFTVGVKAENLLDLPAQRTQGGRVTEQVRTGRGASASLAYAF